ncbi:hypothetical protein EMIT0P100_90197 [Pseudomonas sp. IT-P100]
MAGPFGDEREQQQFQIAGGKHPGASAATLATGAFLEAVAAVTVFAVGGMMVSHFSLSLACLDTT